MTDFLCLYKRSKRFNSHIVKQQAGFTLVDILVGLAMASILMVAVVSLFTTMGRSYTTQNVAADVQEVTRAGVELMTQDIRMAGVNPRQISGVGIVAATPTSIQFTSDLNLNGAIDDTYEQISYYLNADRLMQQLFAGNPMPLVENVTILSFDYRDENDDPVTDLVGDLAKIRTVIISLTVQEPAGRAGPLSRTYTARVRCRNLGL
jgi:type II secretory pathway component PulJ